jgi:hypothetical protein
MREAKNWDPAAAEVVAVRPALEFPNVALLRNAKALKLETNACGSEGTEVVAEVAGEREVSVPKRHVPA